MANDELFQACFGTITAGVIVTNGRITQAAPVLSRWKEQRSDALAIWVYQHGGTWTRVTSRQGEDACYGEHLTSQPKMKE